jgi:hypothetical protein
VNALLVIPAGLLGFTADTLAVAAGPSLYWLSEGSPSWQTSSISAVFGFVTTIDALTVFPAGDFPGIAEDVVVVASQGQLWIYGTLSGVLDPTGPELFCPSGSTGSCPPGVSSLARLPGTPPSVLVEHGGVTYSSALHFDAGGALYFQWQSVSMSSFSCAH